jgi:hypothetical protein
MRFFTGPDIEECADKSFVMLVLPHSGHSGLSCVEIMRISLDFPQSSHMNS